MANRLSVCLPFPGFYETPLMGTVQQRVDNWREEFYPDVPEDVFERGFDWKLLFEMVAQRYVVTYAVVADWQGVPLHGLKFEALVSPREYNHQTDRVFATLPANVAVQLFNRSANKKLNHYNLRLHIEQTFMPRAGFVPHYSDDLDVWLAKPVTTWDHNELQLLVLATVGDIHNEVVATLDDNDEIQQVLNTLQHWNPYAVPSHDLDD